MVSLPQGLRADGIHLSMAQLCRWFEQPRRTVYYRPIKSPSKVKPELAELIEAEPSFGYRTVAGLLAMNKNTVHRIFQLKCWQVRKRAVGHRPRIEALPSVAQAPDKRWATDLCRVWGGRHGWLTLALVMDCHTRQVLGWQVSRSGKATTAAAALEQALITRYGVLARVSKPFLLRSENGLVFTSRIYTRLVRSYGLKQEFITPYCPQQNRMVERLIRTVKKPCVRRHCFENQRHALRIVGDSIQFLQSPPTAPGARYEDPRRGVRFSGLSRAETAGSLHSVPPCATCSTTKTAFLILCRLDQPPAGLPSHRAARSGSRPRPASSSGARPGAPCGCRRGRSGRARRGLAGAR